MNHESLELSALELAGLETRASNDDPSPIGALWGSFFSDARMQKVPALDDDVVAVYCEYEGDHTRPYTFFLGRRIGPDGCLPEGLPEGIVRRRVPAGKFARIVSVGEQPGAMIAAWQEIWGMPLARRYDHDFEVHPAADPTRVEIHVGVDG